jgi:hypothetical protein
MHPGQIAERKGLANQRIDVAVEKLAKKFKIEFDTAALNPTKRDPVVADMLKVEAMADLLELLAEKAVKGKPAAEPAPVNETPAPDITPEA